MPVNTSYIYKICHTKFYQDLMPGRKHPSEKKKKYISFSLMMRITHLVMFPFAHSSGSSEYNMVLGSGNQYYEHISLSLYFLSLFLSHTHTLPPPPPPPPPALSISVHIPPNRFWKTINQECNIDLYYSIYPLPLIICYKIWGTRSILAQD